jgi:hypothetical protein
MISRPFTWWMAAVALAAGCSSPGQDTGDSGMMHTGGRPDEASARVPPAVAQALLAGEPARVLVRLRQERVDPPQSRDDRRHLLEQRASMWTERAGDFVRDLPLGARFERTYRHTPVVVVELRDLQAAYELAGRPEVESLEPDTQYELALTQSLDLVSQPEVEALGYLGTGVAVAVLDTGANYAHSDLGSCSAVGTPSSTCRVVYAADFATQDNSLDANGHGTNVSAIVAAVAPDADIIALDVFDGSSASSSVILAAMDWVIDNQDAYNIASMNLSLGSGSYTSACTDSFTTTIDAARTAGVSVVVSSGNSAYDDAISSPACNAAAISVGAVYDANVGAMGWSGCSDASTAADQVTCFSNAADFLDILAPGALVTAGGYTMGGTSQAAPHVAGALAVLRGADPSSSIDDLEDRLLTTDTTVTDTRNSLQFPRLDLLTAVEATPVSGTVSINAGAYATSSPSVTLTLSSGQAAEVCISSSTTCTAWQAFATELPWTTSSGAGVKTVYATFRDASLVTSQRVSDTILVDTVKPTNGTVTATGGDAQIALSWTGFADASSGIASYKVMQATGTTAPSSCTTGTPVYTGSATTTTITSLINGTTYAFRVCAVDNAGNVSTGSTASAYPAPEYTPPTGTISLNAGAAWSNTSAVTATLSATDVDSDVTHACLSNTTTCSTWFAMTASKSWTLTTAAGTKTVYAWFKDTYGNVSTVINDTIGLDSTKPVNGTLTATGGDGEVALSWTGFTDATSGVASYKVMQAASATAPANCTTGTPVYDGTATSTTLTGLTNGTTYAFRVCAVDTAGNTSTGVTTTSVPASETTPPTGTISLNAGAAWTSTTAVTATLSATDDTSVSEACLSNTTTCSTWFAYTTSKSWTLTTTAGTKTVYAWFKDANGNVSTVINDTIGLDSTKPVNGTLTATGGDGEVALSWTSFSDASAGIASYKVMQATGSTAPANCTTGTPVYDGTATTTTLTGLTNGTTYAFRVCAVDNAGNVSTGATASAMAAAETTPPTGTISLNSAADWTSSTTVTATLSATDDSTVTEACLSNTTTCSTWFAMTASKSWTLTTTAGTKTVYAWFKDENGNVSTVINDTIGLDKTKPAGGTVVAAGGDAEVALSWSGFTDDSAGVGTYKVMQATGSTAPANCTTGTPVYDGTATSTTLTGLTNGTAYAFRVCAVDNAGNISAGATATATAAPETTPPTGTISLNSAADWSTSSAVTAALTATDDSGVTEACLSNTTTCSTWFAMTASKSWTLSTGAGTKTVYAWYKDTYGNVSTVINDTIGLDSTKPVNGTITATPDDGEVALSWTGYTDATSGVASYKVMQATGSTAPANCTTGTPVYDGTATSTTLTALTNGTTYAFRVCAVDTAGNISTGATISAVPASETTPPTGTISLNAGAAWTNSSTVTATLSATDVGSTVAEACLSNTTTCSTWFAYTTSKSWAMATGTGLKTVFAWFKDANGNISAAVSDTISVDSTKPVNGTVTATGGDAEIALSWTGFSDASSGIASYKVMQATSATAPSSCTTGTPVYDGTATSTTISSLTNGTTYAFRVCAVDNAGNISTGSTTSAIPAPEYTPPTGTVSLNAGAAWTSSSSVTATLSATDVDSDVTHACLSNTTTCSTWFAYTTSKSWSLASGTGSKTVYAWYKDTYGNVSTVTSDAISVDSTKPVDGTVTATGDDTEIALSWTGFSDASAGIASYKVMQATSATAPSSCTTGTPVYDGTATSTTISSLTNGTTYSFRVCAVDNAGNISTGSTASAIPAPEYTPPTGTISLNAGAAWSNVTAVTATLSATDVDSTVTHACLSNTTTCSTWFTYTTSKSWTLATGSGTKTVYAWYKDTYGNVSTVINDTIGLDTVKPANGAVNITAATGGANVSWTGYSDTTSGIATYTLVYATGSAPSTCSTGTQGYSGATASTSLSGLTAGTTYYLRVCAVDTAGNISTGTTGSFTAL